MAELADSAVGRRLRWLLDAAASPPTEGEIEEQFAPMALRMMPLAMITEGLKEMPWMATAEVEILGSSETQIAVALAVDGQVHVHLSLEVEPAPPHRISGLSIKPPGPSRLEILDTTPPTTTEVADVIEEHFAPVSAIVDAGGIVVGVSRQGTRTVKSFDADPAVRYEIGSITKTFTALLLAQMVGRGEVAFDDPVSRYLPPSVTVPREPEREITLGDLATQSSGLPSLPPTIFDGSDPDDPYAHVDVDRFYRDLAATTLVSKIGEVNSYSNFGFGLLAHTLALAAGMPFADLLIERICRPLRMDDTDYGDTGVTQGHNHSMAVPRWSGEMFYGAGCRLASTIDDMLTYAEVNMDPTSTSLGAA
ncbi:MAG: serine hydrolase, partial [Actinomycetota bacterium]